MIHAWFVAEDCVIAVLTSDCAVPVSVKTVVELADVTVGVCG